MKRLIECLSKQAVPKESEVEFLNKLFHSNEGMHKIKKLMCKIEHGNFIFSEFYQQIKFSILKNLF